MKRKILLSMIISIIILLFAVAIGSVYIAPMDILRVLGHKLFGQELPTSFDATQVSIIWNLRLPRALLAFIVGAMLSVSGAIMQSVLKNSLASSYTLGVSSGASLGAGIVFLFGVSIPFLGVFSLPLLGFIFALGTIVLVIGFAIKVGGGLENNTIILSGMVISLFANALVTLMSAISREQIQRLIFWQMGSFASKDWMTVFILLAIVIVGTIYMTHYHQEMDMLTFGEEQAQAMGVNTKRTKWILLITAAAMTGSAISFVGVIGFVDLVAPHVVRKVFGSAHRLVIPMSAVWGGAFMVICDLVARTIVPQREIPVGAVTALLGAPFFAYIYFSKRAR